MRHSEAFLLKIITQDRGVFEGDVLGIQAPGQLAPFEVLTRHAPMISGLEAGEARVTEGNASSPSHRYLALTGGVLEVRRDGVTVLADAAEWADEIDHNRAEEARKRAASRMSRPTADIDLDRARAALLRAVARLRVADRVV